ncbi:hypothetical protein F5877DRAFT_82142 [Lentinula edodes]|nr:hypothetical protein F5877DRAFT_82142 [Lentinula edodes]
MVTRFDVPVTEQMFQSSCSSASGARENKEQQIPSIQSSDQLFVDSIARPSNLLDSQSVNTDASTLSPHQVSLLLDWYLSEYGVSPSQENLVSQVSPSADTFLDNTELSPVSRPVDNSYLPQLDTASLQYERIPVSHTDNVPAFTTSFTTSQISFRPSGSSLNDPQFTGDPVFRCSAPAEFTDLFGSIIFDSATNDLNLGQSVEMYSC